MITQEEFFELAQLSEASYANLENVNRASLITALRDYDFNKWSLVKLKPMY